MRFVTLESHGSARGRAKRGLVAGMGLGLRAEAQGARSAGAGLPAPAVHRGPGHNLLPGGLTWPPGGGYTRAGMVLGGRADG